MCCTERRGCTFFGYGTNRGRHTGRTYSMGFFIENHLIRCLWASPPPNRQGLPRSLCIPEYMALHITPASHAVALSVSSLHVIEFDPSESLFTCTFLTTLDWIRLNAAACIPPRFLSEPLSPGFSEITCCRSGFKSN